MSLTLTPRRKDENEAGYFRLGQVILQIPPEEIQTEKILNNKEVSPLRSRHPMQQKTGFARLDATIRWKALINYAEGGIADYSQWEDLQRVLATFIAAPFAEVENAHLRQLIMKEVPTFADGDRMGFGAPSAPGRHYSRHCGRVAVHPDALIVQLSSVQPGFRLPRRVKPACERL